VNGDALAFLKSSIEKREQAKLVREQKKSRERHDLKQKYDAILMDIVRLENHGAMVQVTNRPRHAGTKARSDAVI
jgi:hypothetical protein